MRCSWTRVRDLRRPSAGRQCGPSGGSRGGGSGSGNVTTQHKASELWLLLQQGLCPPGGVSRRVWGHCHRWRWGAPGVWGCGVQRVTLTESHPAPDASAVRLRGRDVAGSDLTGPELQSRRDVVSSHWAPPTSPRAALCAGGCGGRRRSMPLPTRFSSRRMKTTPPHPSSGSATTVHGGGPRPPDWGPVLVRVLVPLATGLHSRRRA